MIPLHLRLTNFMSYANPAPIDLNGLHIVVLCGENGAGKSTLLDAMTWALWGKARARTEKELIRQGQSQMEVRFEFGLHGNRYEVRRLWQTSGKTTKSTLELAVAGEDGQWRPLTENSIRETQAKIDRLLRLNYETFVNSAFLRQGRADEFTTCLPSKRKEILADILGLSDWEEYEERARNKVRAIEATIAQLNGQLQEIERELARRPQYEQDLQTAQVKVIEVSARLREIEDTWQQIQHSRQMRDHKLETLKRLKDRLAQEETHQQRINSQLAQAKNRLAEHQAITERRAEIEAAYASLLAARTEESQLATQANQQLQLRNQILSLESSIDKARNELEREIQLDRERLERAQAQATEAVAVKAELENMTAGLQQVETAARERDRLQKAMTDLSGQAGALKASNETLKAEMTTLREQIDTLESAGAICPTCRQKLTEAARMQLIQQIQAEGQAKKDRYQQNRASQAAIEDQLKTLQFQAEACEKEIKTGASLHSRKGKLEQRLSQAHEATLQIEPLQQRLDELQARKASGEYARPWLAKRDSLQAQLDHLGYNAAVHQAVRERVSRLTSYESQHSRLQLALDDLPKVQEQVQALQASYDHYTEGLGAGKIEQSQLEKEIATLNSQLADAGRIETERARLQQEERTARERMNRSQQMLDVLEARKKERAEKLEAREKAQEEKSLYEDLRLAFGKKGVPAMMIETALPAIETTANELLSRMTNGRMHVRLETQRDSQRGDPIETLDILIADELGTRDYALFSGGEGFRINFALRIAISRLLAYRAGAQLQTLIVDEGFGSQDSQGRERLVDAINAIASDFERILVITHIDELRDAFPARIEVTKGPEGSRAVIG